MSKSRIKVFADGREIATGYQWTKRVRELKQRAQGYCEAGIAIDGRAAVLPGHASHYIGDAGDPHHIVKRSKARDDRTWAMRWICRDAHIQIHRRKQAIQDFEKSTGE